MQETFYTMKLLLFITVPFFLLSLAFVTVTGMYTDSGDIALPVFLVESIGVLLVFLLICFIIHTAFHLLNRRFRFMKTDRYYIALRVVSILCFFIPLGVGAIVFFILFPLSFKFV